MLHRTHRHEPAIKGSSPSYIAITPFQYTLLRSLLFHFASDLSSHYQLLHITLSPSLSLYRLFSPLLSTSPVSLSCYRGYTIRRRDRHPHRRFQASFHPLPSLWSLSLQFTDVHLGQGIPSYDLAISTPPDTPWQLWHPTTNTSPLTDIYSTHWHLQHLLIHTPPIDTYPTILSSLTTLVRYFRLLSNQRSLWFPTNHHSI